MLRRRLLRWAVLLAAFYAVGSVAAAWALTTRWPFSAPPLLDSEWRQDELQTDDGMRLQIWYRTAGGRPLIVLAHGYHSSAGQLAPLARVLDGAGYDVVLFDFRAHGRSSGSVVSAGWNEARDVEAVLGWVRERRGSLVGVGLVGMSMGAAAAALAPSTADLDTVVLVGCYATLAEAVDNRFRMFLGLGARPLAALMQAVAEWRLGIPIDQVRPIDELPRLGHRPCLVIHATHDRRVGTDTGERLQRALGNRAELVLYAGDHLDLYRIADDLRLRAPLLDFLQRALPPEGF